MSATLFTIFRKADNIVQYNPKISFLGIKMFTMVLCNSPIQATIQITIDSRVNGLWHILTTKYI